MATQSCGTCKHWIGQFGKHGRALHKAGRCGAPIPAPPVLPEAYLFRFQWPPSPQAAWDDDGAACSLWSGR